MAYRKKIRNIIPSHLYHHVFNSFGNMFYQIDKRHRSMPQAQGRCGMLLITIAFNNEELISTQIEMVRKHVKDANYQLLIVDNSTDKTKRKKIQDVCTQHGIEYIPIPLTLRQKICKNLKWGGMSHGLALNWTFYHVICNRQPKYFALLDHDIFPVKDCNLTERLGDLDFFGVRRDRGKYWYLWPGWSIFNFDAIATKSPNFQPYFTKSDYLDSGGGNYFKIYNNYALSTIPFPNGKTQRLKKTKGLSVWNDVYHCDCIQMIDDCWLHIINGSNYCHLPGKDATIKKIIDNIHIFENND